MWPSGQRRRPHRLWAGAGSWRRAGGSSEALARTEALLPGPWLPSQLVRGPPAWGAPCSVFALGFPPPAPPQAQGPPSVGQPFGGQRVGLPQPLSAGHLHTRPPPHPTPELCLCFPAQHLPPLPHLGRGPLSVDPHLRGLEADSRKKRLGHPDQSRCLGVVQPSCRSSTTHGKQGVPGPVPQAPDKGYCPFDKRKAPNPHLRFVS